ncbi:MAG: HAMP domain-containing protein, partial [Chloroflexi bacterium]
MLSSSYPGRFPVGASAYSLIPNLDLGRAGVGGQTSTLGDGRVASAIEPIFLTALRAKGASPDTKTTFAKPQAQGYVYVQAPLQTTLGTTLATAGPLLQSGLLLLLLTLPVGALFGLLTTRGLVRRLRRLESTTLAFAEGDLSRRVVPSG